MAQLRRSKLYSVVGLALGHIDVKGSLVPQTIGTGFIYADSRQRGWTVTCKHVIEEIEKRSKHVLIRVNKQGHKGMVPFRTAIHHAKEGPGWTFHPSADVAVHVLSPDVLESNDIQYMALHNGYTREDAKKVPLLEGDDVFLIGFPQGWREGLNDYPVVRSGIIAQIQGWYAHEHDTFLVDGSGFGGNSGGPVVTKPALSLADGLDKSIIIESKLIGMVSGVTRQPVEPAEISVSNLQGKETERGALTKFAFLQHSDLIEVVPVEHIEETIELAALQCNDK